MSSPAGSIRSADRLSATKTSKLCHTPRDRLHALKQLGLANPRPDPYG